MLFEIAVLLTKVRAETHFAHFLYWSEFFEGYRACPSGASWDARCATTHDPMSGI